MIEYKVNISHNYWKLLPTWLSGPGEKAGQERREIKECSKVSSKNAEISRFIIPTPSSMRRKAVCDILISMVLHQSRAQNASKPLLIHKLYVSLAYRCEWQVYSMETVSDLFRMLKVYLQKASLPSKTFQSREGKLDRLHISLF